MTERKPMTRRAFLHGTAAAVAAPYIVPASSLGKSYWIAPSERITVGFIGIGNMGGGHLGGFLDDRQVQVVAACDVDANKRRSTREAAEKKYGQAQRSGTYKGCAEYNEFEKLLERPDIDAVLIAVPDHWHAIISIHAARCGKDIYCEKPLSLTVREAEAMVAAVRRYNRVFQTGSQQRSEHNFRFACELVQNGRIGKLKTVHVNIGMPSAERYLPEEPVREGLDWDRWLGPAPWQPYNAERCSGSYSGGWRLIRDYSGGMTTDWGAHHFDIGQWGMGMDGHGPVEIRPPMGNEPLTFIYENGVKMFRSNQAEGHGNVNGILFTGTDGRVEVNRGYLKAWPESLLNERIGPNEIHLYESPGHRQDWINCIRSRQRPICDVAIGASTITVCHLANIASWLDRPIRWDPVKRVIVGDLEASRWLDRPKRAPWRLYL
ncbi:MAG: Gfo/Idh/MocA family oxidoreductase [Phycisphaerae bacterium]|jgi:predicted dehydrogenase